MASIRNRINNLSKVIDSLENGGSVVFPDPEVIAEVEAMVTGKISIPDLTPEEHEAILKELGEVSKAYRMSIMTIRK